MKTTLHLFLICVCFTSFSQKSAYKGLPSLVWPKLYNIEFQKEKDFNKPVFSKETKLLANKIISLPGYMVPFENGMKGSHFMLTSLPLNACFFCGVGGPETIVEVYLAKPIGYTDKPIEVKGKLILNDKNPDKMIYILENAEMMGEIDF
ncbi:MAG: hypothetical protein HYZ44_12480 [Bacteroidetes bacterium]|nr:hypothetical protein [Bacteroidota bacterium]